MAATFKIEQDNTTNQLIKAYKNNNLARTLKEEQTDKSLLTYNRRTYIPKSMIDTVIRNHYNNPLLGHPGIAKTKKVIQRVYDFPELEKAVHDYITACIICQKDKAARHAKYRQIQFTKIPTFL